MRYGETPPGLLGAQARSRRIGRCLRCHAPVLADEEHYDTGSGVVHGACGTDTPPLRALPEQPSDPSTPECDARRLTVVGGQSRPYRSANATASVLVGAGRRA